MNVLIPFPDLSIFERYERQFRAVRAQVDKVYILYFRHTGIPETYWETVFEFIPYDLPYRHITGKFRNISNWVRLWLGSRYCPSFCPPDIDIVYSISGAWINLYGQEIAEFFEVPHVIRLRGLRAEVIKYTKRNIATKKILQRLHEDCLRRATLVTPISDRLRYYMKGIGVQEAHTGDTVYNGVDLSRVFVWSFPDKFTPAYVGRISEEKGSQFLMKLIEASPYTWKVTGDIQDKDFTPPTNCHYLGKTPYDLMTDFYQSVSVLVIPSFTEGFPNVILEAYGQGRPIVGTYKGVPEDVSCFGRLVPQNIELWLKALEELERDYTHLGYMARGYAKDWTWEKHGAGIRSQLDKAIRIHSSNN
jgi:glycosyltransferase involved in cell wall biosynthesis